MCILYLSTFIRIDCNFIKSSVPLINTNSNGGRVWSFNDISDRKKIENALKESEEKYRSLTENIPIGLYRNTPGAKGKFLEVIC